MKSAKLYQFPQRGGRTASISTVHSEDSFNTQNGSLKTNRTAGWKMIMPWTIGLIWLFLGMFWPLLNWIGAMDVVFCNTVKIISLRIKERLKRIR